MKKIKGFTLIELIIVIMITGIITAIASNILAEFGRAYRFSATATDITESGQLAISFVGRDLAKARQPLNLTLLSPGITFVTTDNNTISYTLSGTTLMRNLQPLATDVTTLNVTLLKANGEPTLSASNARLISFVFSIKKLNIGQTFSITSGPRNFPP